MNVCGHHDCLRTLEVAAVLAALEEVLRDLRGDAAGGAANQPDRRAAGGEETRWRR